MIFTPPWWSLVSLVKKIEKEEEKKISSCFLCLLSSKRKEESINHQVEPIPFLFFTSARYFKELIVAFHGTSHGTCFFVLIVTFISPSVIIQIDHIHQRHHHWCD